MSRDVLNCQHITNVELLNEAMKSPRKNVLGSYSCSYMLFETTNENNRWYGRQIATERILNKKVVDKLKKGIALLGEIDHPEKRFNTNSKYVAIATTKLWYDEDKKELFGEFDVLDTPNGQIVKTLIDYGYPIGISARAVGDSKQTRRGIEIDAKSYMFKTFDIVVDPGFATSRVDNKEELKEALNHLYEGFDANEQSNLKPLYESWEITSKDIYNNEPHLGCESNGTQTLDGERSQAPLLQEGIQIIANESGLEYNPITSNEVVIKELELRIAILESEAETNSKVLSEKDITISDLEGQLNTINESISTLNNSLYSNELKLSKAKTKLTESLRAIKELETEKADNKVTINKLTNLTESLSETIGELETEKADNKVKLNSYKSKLNEAYSKLGNSQNEIIHLNESLELISKPKKNSIKMVSIINESVNDTKPVDPTVDRLLKNMNKKGV